MAVAQFSPMASTPSDSSLVSAAPISEPSARFRCSDGHLDGVWEPDAVGHDGLLVAVGRGFGFQEILAGKQRKIEAQFDIPEHLAQIRGEALC